jgi:hypothetical protein
VKASEAAAHDMRHLEDDLRKHFGGRNEEGTRLVAIDDAHAIHEAGYEVRFSRYSVTYCDMVWAVTLGAEFDDDGVLEVHSGKCSDREAVERISTALDFLGVRHIHIKK